MGQIIKRNYEIELITEDQLNEERLNYTVAGSLCIPDDRLATEIELSASVKEGDILVFFNSGAYAYSASPLFFLSHPLPDEILI